MNRLKAAYTVPFSHLVSDAVGEGVKVQGFHSRLICSAHLTVPFSKIGLSTHYQLHAYCGKHQTPTASPAVAGGFPN